MTAVAPSAWQIQQIVSLARQTLAGLREDHGQVIDDDDQTLDALAGEGVDAATALSSLGRAALDAKAWVEATNARIDDLCARRDRAERREEILRETLLSALMALGLSAHKDVEFTASWRHGKPKLLVTDVAALPADLVTEQVVRVADRTAVRAALDAGEMIPGATLGNAAPILMIRNK